MKRFNILFIFFLFSSKILFSQINYDCKIILEKITDEELFESQEIFTESGPKRKYRTRIINQKFNNNNLELLLGMKSFEKGSPKCNIKFERDTLKIKFKVPWSIDYKGEEYIGIGSSKYWEVKININNLNQNPQIIMLNDEQIKYSDEMFITYPTKFEIVNGDTINFTDKYGQRQGLWIENFRPLKMEGFYIDSELDTSTITEYYIDGKIKTESYFSSNISDGDIIGKSYYADGNLKSEYYFVSSSGVYLQKWNIDNILIQKNEYDGEQIVITQYDVEGQLELKCKTKIGTGYFKGIANCWTRNDFKIPCISYDSSGNIIEEKEKLFYIYPDILPR